MAIAEYVTGLLGEAGLDITERTDLPAPPRMPNIGEVGVRPYQDADRIIADPEYGRVVCFCERVTAGEIRDSPNGSGWSSAAHPRNERPLPGLLLRRPHACAAAGGR
jgi:hypothetical protein